MDVGSPPLSKQTLPLHSTHSGRHQEGTQDFKQQPSGYHCPLKSLGCAQTRPSYITPRDPVSEITTHPGPLPPPAPGPHPCPIMNGSFQGLTNFCCYNPTTKFMIGINPLSMCMFAPLHHPTLTRIAAIRDILIGHMEGFEPLWLLAS